MIGNFNPETPELSSEANEQLADDVEVLVRFLVQASDFELPEPDEEAAEDLPPQMQAMSQQISTDQILDMVMPQLRYLVAENEEEAKRMLRVTEENVRDVRDHYEDDA